MKLYKKLLLLIMIVFTWSTFACNFTSFESRTGERWAFKGFNFDSHLGYIFLNLRNVQKKSMVPSYEQSLEWVSKYANITFNQPGRDFPFGGMNEKGLVMEILWLDETDFPLLQQNPTINESQIIQYTLDNATTVNEAIELIKGVDLDPIFAPVHYALCDNLGKCSIVEYLNKELKISPYEKEQQVYISNSTFKETMAYLSERQVLMFDDFKTSTTDFQSAFLNLDKFNNYAEWQIAYNMSDLTVGFKTIANRNLTLVDFKTANLDCTQDISSLAMNLNDPAAAENGFEPYTSSIDEYLLGEMNQVSTELRMMAMELAPLNHRCLNE